jgi:NAD(P)-dependent dehydrogenase (short-subunit alcohol dehydrogenase family)
MYRVINGKAKNKNRLKQIKMDLKLKGKKAFISGSTQGIGYAIAQQLLTENVEVTINGRHKEKTEQAKNKLQQQFPNSTISAITADFTNKEEVEMLLGELNDIDILINNVGIFEVKDFENTTDKDWYDYFEINVMSGVRLSRLLLPQMLNKKWGRIIFISSESGVNIPGNMIHYGMTKAAIMAIGNGMSKLTKGTEVTVNTILGGPTYSSGVANVVEQIAENQHISVDQMKNAIMQQTNPHSLLQRFIEPSEIANLATYLSSPLSIATNGSCLRADGGVLKTI